MGFWKRGQKSCKGKKRDENEDEEGLIRSFLSSESPGSTSRSKDHSEKTQVQRSFTEKVSSDKSQRDKNLIRKPLRSKTVGDESQTDRSLIQSSFSSNLTEKNLDGNVQKTQTKDKRNGGKAPIYEYEVFVHTHTHLTSRDEILHFRSKVADGRAEVIKKKNDYLLKDRRGLCIHITHKSRDYDDVLECVRALLEELARDEQIDHCRLIRHCPRRPGELD